jgi:integrase
VQLQEGFWGTRQTLNRSAIIPHAVDWMDRLGWIRKLALAVGLRRGEALALRWQDVDLDRGELRVSQSLQRLERRLRFEAPKSERARVAECRCRP